MCGIVGIISKNSIEPDVLIQARDMLKHRGPDDGGIFVSKDGKILLGHRRLSIIDISFLGHQPMSTPDGRFHMVFNGEVYNYLEIKKELENFGYQFKSTSDTEVVLYAFERWRENSFSRFIGMFAIAIWDDLEKKLYLCRDRLGKKPLYYYFYDGVFAFASELKALKSLPGFYNEIEPNALALYLQYNYISGAFSIYKNLKKLPAGCYLVFDIHSGHVSLDRYWTYSTEKIKTYPYEKWLNILDNLLLSSVKYRMTSDVPLGALLSGGIDSSLMVAYMRQLSDNVETFSIGCNDPEHDESDDARMVANSLRTKHHEMIVNAEQVLDTTLALSQIYDEPFADVSAVPTLLVSKLASKHVKVAISGDGGDELFLGYENYRRINRLLPFFKIPFNLRKSLSLLFLLSTRANVGAATYNEAFRQRTPMNLYQFIVSTWKETDIERLIGFDPKSSSHSDLIFNSLNQDEWLEKLSEWDINNYLIDDILVKVDRASMACSLEMRAPLIDHRIVEAAFQMPMQVKWNRGKGKRILRDLLKKYLPSYDFSKPKKGFWLPIERWIDVEFKDVIHDMLSSSYLSRQGIFQTKFINNLLKDHYSGKHRHTGRIWNLLIFQLWFRHSSEPAYKE